MFLLMIFLYFTQLSEINLYLSKQTVSVDEFKIYKKYEGFEIEYPSDGVSIFLGKELYPYAYKYRLSQPLKFRKTIENNIELNFEVYYNTADETVKYYRLTLDKKKPDIDVLMKKYLTTTSNVQSAAEQSVKELETYRLLPFETEVLTKEIEQMVSEKYGKPAVNESNRKIWKNAFSTVELQKKENYLTITGYWE